MSVNFGDKDLKSFLEQCPERIRKQVVKQLGIEPDEQPSTETSKNSEAPVVVRQGFTVIQVILLTLVIKVISSVTLAELVTLGLFVYLWLSYRRWRRR